MTNKSEQNYIEPHPKLHEVSDGLFGRAAINKV
jgi:hypothetical protein